MNDNNSGEFGAFLAGFVIGGLVGAAAALILAPQSGSETRTKIAGKGQDLREAGGQRVHQAREEANQYLHRSDDSDSEDDYDVQEQARIVLDSGRQQSETVEDDSATSDEADPSATNN